ncbi:Phenylalanine--tRNA ligase, mitochondrial isoform X2 [Oopsacas minuta]|uniref:Phenylalanine--tRNA ligase, mitochondrial n=1 Tax=Oopsacas minuta TaxID=111878 RepID=A0AAV7KIC2_9METZ|nr:Phenylalanine--tRNA ligase, mitochondrial isoform X2 [Oopsacas minuta]
MHCIRFQCNKLILISYTHSKPLQHYSNSSQHNNIHNNVTISLLDREYPVDNLTTITPTILSKVDRHLHNQYQHPIEIIKRRIVSYFSHKWVDSNGDPLFKSFDNFSPVVSLEQNFDSLRVPLDHVTRSKSDNYYINNQFMLRAHTSAHQRDTIALGHSQFLVTGDVYRRDEIDTKHYPVFHQMEGVELFTNEELFGNEQGSLFDPLKEETEEKQAEHSLETVLAIEKNLKYKLESLMQHLFGNNLQMRWSGTYFPFTHPSYELEIYWNDKWLEVLGSGVMRQHILVAGGKGSKAGYAFGLGLERLAMILFGIPDIRLFWSKDRRFIDQFINLQENSSLNYKPFSLQPPAMRDMSFWINNGEFEMNDFHEIVRDEGEEWIENVELLDEYQSPETRRKSLCFRITYRCMERTLLGEEIQELHTRITDRLQKEMSVSIR